MNCPINQVLYLFWDRPTKRTESRNFNMLAIWHRHSQMARHHTERLGCWPGYRSSRSQSGWIFQFALNSILFALKTGIGGGVVKSPEITAGFNF